MKRIGRQVVAAACASLFFAGGAAAWAAGGDRPATVPCNFIIRNLGALPGDYLASASGINNAGAAVGYSLTLDFVNFNPVRPVMFFNRNVFLLPTNPQHDLFGLDRGAAVAINDQPVAVGTVFGAKGPTHAARFVGSGATDLGTLLPDGNSYATSINNQGDIVGYADAVVGENGIQQHAVRYAGGVVTDLGILPGGGYSIATSINAHGVAVGYASIATGEPHAVRFAGGRIIDLGVPRHGSDSQAFGINNQGLAVGSANFGGGADHAALFANGSITDLGVLPGGTTSTATAINRNGHAVGWSDNGTGFVHPVMFAHRRVLDLGTPAGITDAFPAGVNDLDQVVGTVRVASSPIPDTEQTLAVTWTPTGSCPLLDSDASMD